MKATRFLANTLVILHLYFLKDSPSVRPAEIAPRPAWVRLEQPATPAEALTWMIDAERERLGVADAARQEQAEADPAGPGPVPADGNASHRRGLRRRRFRRFRRERPLRPASRRPGLAYWVVRHASRTHQGSSGRARRQ
jgi:hypothetical protein